MKQYSFLFTNYHPAHKYPPVIIKATSSWEARRIYQKNGNVLSQEVWLIDNSKKGQAKLVSIFEVITRGHHSYPELYEQERLELIKYKEECYKTTQTKGWGYI